MKKFKFNVKSYFFNNSDHAQYDVYSIFVESLEDAKKYAEKYAKELQKKSNNNILYFIEDVWEV